ncbi:hypothetical protein VTL71DRAFT_10957 [Oculimacula yallundae]|uniref:SET domain-containing protein n=1 Tax=Oculimacula yallundae TaxID=86028 RepID=A0ABR4CUM2_9HELO
MIEVRAAGAAGLGVFALKLIPRGTRIFSERALLTLQPNNARAFYPTLKRLSRRDRDVFMELKPNRSKEMDFWRWSVVLGHTVVNVLEGVMRRNGTGDGRKFGSENDAVSVVPDADYGTRNSLSDHVAAMSIFRSNAFDIGGGFGKALFPRTARINHSCLPNSQGNFNSDSKRFNVHATRDIKGGEEVSLNYLLETGQLRRQRMEKLSEGYGFECGCPACDFENVGTDKSVGGSQGERKRIEMGDMLKDFVESGRGKEMEMETYMGYIKLFESEGIAGKELSNMYIQAVDLLVDKYKHKEALKLAALALQLDKDCFGTDHPEYKKSLEIVKALKEALRQRSTAC